MCTLETRGPGGGVRGVGDKHRNLYLSPASPGQCSSSWLICAVIVGNELTVPTRQARKLRPSGGGIRVTRWQSRILLDA